MPNKIYTQENYENVKKIFGNPLGRVPEIYPAWDGPTGTIFWASSECWNSFMLHRESGACFKFAGPYSKETVPYNAHIPCDGFSIFVPDKDD